MHRDIAPFAVHTRSICAPLVDLPTLFKGSVALTLPLQGAGQSPARFAGVVELLVPLLQMQYALPFLVRAQQILL